ncbi:MBL fold hydrolase [Reichenbachiella sp. 5M10]|uniref:MBL fold metallo-hydrolase n=1 Tax=Reichenbachiella sp. 5M10 TaxID=1889772 RepID=UPI000C14A7B0|nr:MBL fold metallo-hydrolase [Reichenbachiella sp. 5M10]PIB37108.1 MBL fold hydrolase [Reichenbachiella sp. 5M10]
MAKINTIDLHFKGLEHAIASYLIETSDGPVLIETGPHSTYPALVSAIQSHGYHLEDIRHVLLTHIHLDHAGAAWAFAEQRAQIYLHPFGARNMADPSRLMASARQIYQEQMDSLWGQMKPIPETQLTQVEHQQTVTIGGVNFVSLHTPGHAKHHIAWQIEDSICTGDVAGVKIGGGPVQPPCPPPDIHIEDWLDSIALLRQRKAKRLYLTHYDYVENIDEHLDQLSTMLESWSSFVYEHWKDGLSNEAIIPLFQSFTTDQLRASGLNNIQIAQYEAANPSWMSVAGLVRYWTKKTQP